MHTIFKFAFLTAFALSGSYRKGKNKTDVGKDKKIDGNDKPDVNAENRKKAQSIFDKINLLLKEVNAILNRQHERAEEEELTRISNTLYFLMEEIVKNPNLYVEALDLSAHALINFFLMPTRKFTNEFYGKVYYFAGIETVEQLKKAFGYDTETGFGTEVDEVSKALVNGEDFKKSWRAFAEALGEVLKNCKHNLLLERFKESFVHFRKEKEEKDEKKEEESLLQGKERITKYYECDFTGRELEEEVVEVANWNSDNCEEEIQEKSPREAVRLMKRKKWENFWAELMQQEGTFIAFRYFAHAVGDAVNAAGIMLLQKAKH